VSPNAKIFLRSVESFRAAISVSQLAAAEPEESADHHADGAIRSEFAAEEVVALSHRLLCGRRSALAVERGYNDGRDVANRDIEGNK